MIDDVILCVKKGKCYDSVDNIEYIAYVSNDVRDVSLHRMSDMSLVMASFYSVENIKRCFTYTYAVSYA